MDLLQGLQIASAVLHAGSFSAAARQRSLTPAAVAKQVAQLEARLGLRLFERSTRHLAPTEEGRELLQRLQAPLRALEDALGGEAGTRAARGVVKVSVPASFARMAVIPFLPDFQRAHPALQLDLRLENRRVDLLAEGYDCAIGADLAPDATLVARPLATLRPVLCAAPAYLARHGEPRSIAALAGHGCIALRSDTTGRLRDWTLTSRGRSQRLQPAGTLQLTDPESAAAAAIAGCGIALLGLHHVADALADGRLRRVLPEVHGPRFQIVVYFAQRRLLPARTRAFVDHLLATVPQAPALRRCQAAAIA